MRSYLSAALALGLVTGAAGAADLAPPPRPVKDTRAAELDGEYTVTAIGKLPRQSPRLTVKIVIAGEEWTTFTTQIRTGHVDASKMTVKMRPDIAGGAKAIDLMPDEGEGDDGPYPGIYKVENGVVTIAYYRPIGFAPVDPKKFVRPTDFKGRDGVFIEELKRVERK